MKQAYLAIIKTLRECGYKVKGEVLNAMYFNVPQSRERVIIIGVRNDLEIEPSHPKPQGRPITLKEALKDIDYKGIELTGKLAYIGLNAIPGEDFGTTQIRQGATKSKNFSTKKLSWDKPCNTLTKTVGSGFSGLVCPDCNNFLSIDACKRVSSFPKEYKFIGKYEEQWARIGNSVPPNLMKAIAENIKINILDKAS
jgi:DNA (cytosine-5)-methyltransferase 1